MAAGEQSWGDVSPEGLQRLKRTSRVGKGRRGVAGGLWSAAKDSEPYNTPTATMQWTTNEKGKKRQGGI